MIFSFFSGPIFVYLVVSFPLSVSSFYSSWLLPPALSLLFLCFSCSLSHRLCISYLIYCCRSRSRRRCRRLCGLVVVCLSLYVSSNSSHFLLCFTVVVVLSVLSGFLSFSLFFSFVALLPVLCMHVMQSSTKIYHVFGPGGGRLRIIFIRLVP